MDDGSGVRLWSVGWRRRAGVRIRIRMGGGNGEGDLFSGCVTCVGGEVEVSLDVCGEMIAPVLE
jgi:hypothetical protein